METITAATEAPAIEVQVNEAQAALTHELGLQEQTCTYSAETFGLWHRFLRALRAICLAGQVIFGVLALWRILSHDTGVYAIVFTALAAAISPLLSALRLSDQVAAAKAGAAEFAALRDRFRRAASVSSHRPKEELDRIVEPLFIRMERARAETTPPPELFYSMGLGRVRRGRFRPG
jgi:hypothetical protein